jgi:hypothetical protein
LLTTTLITSLCCVGLTASVAEYEPWVDITDDGVTDVFDIVGWAIAFGASGTPITKESVECDSGWIDIMGNAGQSFTVTHSLNTVDIMVDIQGKATIDDGPHMHACAVSDYSQLSLRP